MSVRTYLMKHAGSTTSRPGTSRRVNTSAVLAVVCVALGAVAAAMASLNVALPDLARSTGATQTQLEWIIDAYSLVFAALLLPAGALGIATAAAARCSPGWSSSAGRQRLR